jgi:hypothetical protein
MSDRTPKVPLAEEFGADERSRQAACLQSCAEDQAVSTEPECPAAFYTGGRSRTVVLPEAWVAE